ncbi:hypothetical protein Pmani_036705 [Petrolisthes manimaculis]|uniref:Pentraxin (PTX) domain-containing protein n=1 Tax=Petrolisthes manimaculis TaxID=1843537 RepID=A0AAE1TP57_9EUCA|nr:hypothetical protein Pmani_036705 [Petrolisthes manimaculis]
MVGEQRPLHMNGTVYIGQEQDGLASGLDPMQSTSAFMAQINVWDRLMSESSIAAMASCSDNPLGNILSSDLHDFEVVGAGEERRLVTWLCQNQVEFVIVPEKWHLKPSLQFCSVSSSEMFLPNTDDVNTRLFNETRLFLDQCTGKSYRLMRLGASDVASDGDWRRFADNRRLSYTAWAPRTQRRC